ncbi:MAG: allantoinase AllB [Phycisphaerales bacterium]
MAGDSFNLCSTRVATPTGVVPATIEVRGGRIASVRTAGPATGLSAAPDAAAGTAPTFDVGNLAVLPGIIDAHVHINEPGRTEWEGFLTAGRAAAAGGVTTMVVMPLNCSPVATTAAALLGEAYAAAETCAIDHGFWGGVVPGNAGHIQPLWDAGVLGFKCFLVDSGLDEFRHVSASDLDVAMPLLTHLPPRGAVLLVHAEDPAEIAHARTPSGLDASPRSYAAYLASRPASAETAAIQLMIDLCRKHGTRVHIVHVAAAAALPALARARREGLPVTAETCPHYLAFAAEDIADGQTTFKCAPPIRTRADREGLWAALADGTLDLIASDHSPCPPELKRLDTGDFAQSWGGISSLQLTLPVAWTHAHARGFGLAHIARWLALAPARLAGIDSFKGQIAPGYDADLTIFDPEALWTVRAADLEHRHKATPYDGAALRGRVKATFVRGQQVFRCSGFERLAPLDRHGSAMEATGRWVKRTRM